MKRLELYGFKSFGRRVSVELEQGLNAVVGPNGCGKSNLLDAIRWALGEPNLRSLRGGRTEDIIFGGTRDVRPLGMAEVVLTFDNTSGALGVPYREVELTRRAYRSGQSFFAINGVPCRLRDIQELLSRARFSARSHVLVPQGSAEALAVGGGEERRAALDEVAGIARFRQVCAAVNAVLQRARQAMDRSQAALGESARHLAFLEHQASRARRARELYEALKGIELELLRREALAAHEHHTQAERAREIAEKQLEEARAALQQSRERLQALLAAHGELGSRLSQLSTELEQSRRALLERQHEVDRASDREFDAAGRLERARARLSGLSRQSDDLQARIAELERGRTELASRREQAESEHRELSARLEAAAASVSEKETALEQQRSRLLEALERVAGARNELVEAARQYETQRREWQRANERCEAIRQRRAELEERLQELDAQLASLDARLEANARRQETLAQEMKAAGDRVRQLEQAVSATELERTRLAGQLRLLQQAHDEMEGFSRGVRAVMAADAPWREEIRGPLGQLVRVPQGLEEAAAAALGAFMEAVVVDTADAARRAIEFLRERRLGWVTFLPLDFLRPRRIAPATREALSRLPGWIGLGSELFEVDADLKAALEYAAGRVAVMESLDGALEAGRRAVELARAVTRRGEVVVPGGPVSGGFREHSRAEVLARARRMEEIRRQLRAAEAKAAGERRALEQQAQVLRARQQEAAELEAALQELQSARSSAAGRREALDDERRRLERELSVLEAERRRLEEAVSETERREEQLRAHLDRQQAEEQRWRKALEDLTAELERSRQGRRELEARVMEALARLEALRADEKVLLSRLEQARRDLGTLQEEMASSSRDQDQARQEMEAARRAAQELSAQLALLQAAVERQSEERAELTSRLQSAAGEIEVLRQQVAHLEKAVELHNANWMRAERAAQLARDRWDQVRGRLAELTGAVISNPRDIPVPDPQLGRSPRSHLELRRQELQAELDRIGSVDMQTIAAYEQARREFETAQAAQSDLLSALSVIEAWQRELDGVSLQRLRRMLEAASRAFGEMVARLFGGGEGRLHLEGDGVANGRVELEVRLPSKRPQPAVALSGGERAMVSAAFIFALQKVRPSPICVLDELDAALDEVNLERLIGVVRELAQDRQILFITHRQRTMEAANSLFGVTMDDQGISRLLVLKLGDVPRVLGAELEQAAGA